MPTTPASPGRRMAVWPPVLVAAVLATAEGPLCAAPGAPRQAAAQGLQPPTFNSAVTLVPVDVRVVDRKTGRPVTDLTQRDFTVVEDGVAQEIRLFVTQALEPAPLTRAAGAERLPAAPPPALGPQRARTFLFVLGAGRVSRGPVRGLEAAADFIRSKLLPQDVAAAFAYNRATDFTTDHEAVAGVVDRFRAESDAIMASLDHRWSGLEGVYGSKGLPADAQRRIDRVFAGPAGMPFARTAMGENPQSGDRLRDDMRRAEEAALRAALAGGSAGAQSADAPDDGLALLDWSGFDRFAAATALTMEDVGNLYAAVAYMHSIEGEKHLVFITESGPRLPRGDDFSDFARTAAASRVAVDIVQTGEAFDVTRTSWLRRVSEDTGGLAAVATSGADAFNRLDLLTRSGYLLGYYPRNAVRDGKVRRIRIKVNRPDVTVVHRREYLASPIARDFDRRAYLTRFRLAAALGRDADLADIKVTLAAAAAEIDGQPAAAIDARIDVAALRFTVRDGIRYGRVDFAIVPLDSAGQVLGPTYKKQAGHLEYSEPDFEVVRKEGIPYQVTVRVPAGTHTIRLIAYDYAADALGSARARLK